MSLRLREDPREWRKFGTVGTVLLAALALLFGGRSGLSLPGLQTIGAIAAVCLGLVWWKPRWVRPVYRGAMTGSYWVGQHVGRVLLAIFYVAVLTPVGLALRLFGKDLMRIRGPFPGKSSYWQRVRHGSHLDRLF